MYNSNQMSSLYFNGGDTTTAKPTFFNHVFSTTDEGKAEILNVLQYALLGIIPILLLNKTVHHLIPDANDEKSSIEIIFEIVMQVALMFTGIIFIHRIIAYIPTYSEFKYDALSFTSVILAFFVIMLSIQTKMGIKANILYDRLMDLWNGPSDTNNKRRPKNQRHEPTVADTNPMPRMGMMTGGAMGHEPVPAPVAASGLWR